MKMKTWKKPAVTTLKAGELSAYVRAAARSIMCDCMEYR